jgi:hypothetical protein
MQGQNDPKQREFPESEKGFEQGKDRQGQGPGTQEDRGSQQDRGTGTGTGTATGTAPQNPGTERQNPGTSPDQDSTIRNPSGDDLSEGIEGDEGSGRGI